jgi:hypothetical protein
MKVKIKLKNQKRFWCDNKPELQVKVIIKRIHQLWYMRSVMKVKLNYLPNLYAKLNVKFLGLCGLTDQ